MSDVELITIPGLWAFNYNYFAGANASRFFKELKEHRRIMGTRCPSCWTGWITFDPSVSMPIEQGASTRAALPAWSRKAGS